MPKGFTCTEPGCGKTFLRSEHLSRHRLNHRPKQVHQCGCCPKRFVRKDLLQRHEKRHEKGMWFRNSGGVVVEDVWQTQMPRSTAMLNDDDQVLQDSQMNSRDNNHDDTVDDQAEGTETIHQDHQTNYGVDVQTDTVNLLTEDNVNSLFFDPSSNIPELYNDIEWLFDNASTDINNSVNCGFSGDAPEGISSPATISPPSFPMQLQFPSLRSSTQTSSLTLPLSPWECVQENLLSALNSLPVEVLQSSFFYPSNLAYFYELYFANYNPHFPILHKPTLDPVNAPPLLVVAIVSLGATLSNDATHFEVACKIHDSLRYIIFRTADFEPPASLWCVQTLLIIQAHEKMFSTRKHHQLAHIFHGAIITLMKRGVTHSPSQAPPHYELTALERSWYQWVETQSSNRTAFFGFLMDAQHSFMFGHTCILSVHDVRLPLPCADILWDCADAEEWNRTMKKTPESPGFLPVLKRLLGRTPVPSHCSAYARLILLHGLFSVTAHLKARDSATLGVDQTSSSADTTVMTRVEIWTDTLERAIETWSFSLVSSSSSLALEAAKPLHRIAYVAIYTDITDIHILAGAPSLLGCLLSNNDRLRATARVRAWSEKAETKKALYHCLLLIQEVVFTGHRYRAAEDNIALRPWSLYHATLVLWVYGYMSRQSSGSSDDTVSSSSYGAEEYLVRMLMMLKYEPNDIPRIANRTKGLLYSIMECLGGCRWELLQEAYVTLGKLIEKSN